MGNEGSKPEQVPESENAAKLRAVITDIKKYSKEYDDFEAATKTRRAREDAEDAARTQALAQQARLVEKQKLKAKAAAPGTAVKAEDQSSDSEPSRKTAPNTPLTSAPNSPTEAQDTLAGWNARKEPRPKSSNANDQSQRREADPSVASYGKQELLRQRVDSKESLPEAKKKADQAKASTVQKPQGSLPPKPSVIKASSIVALGSENVLPTLGGKKQSLPSKPDGEKASTKRSEPASGFGQYGSLSGLHAQKRPRSVDLSSSSNSPRSPATTSGDEGERQVPDWYQKLSAVQKRDANNGNADALLGRLKDQIAIIKKQGPNRINTKDLNELRESLHEAPFLAMGSAGPQLLRTRRMLHNDGLPQLFDNRYAGSMKGHWPWDIQSDAAELYHKWCSKNFDDDMLYGLILAQKTKNAEDDRKGDRVDQEFQKSSKYKGNGKLVNGQWWPTLLCALRDGAHGDSQAGISGDTGIGAYSCFMSGGKHHPYPDKDEGAIVHYYGQDSTTGQMSRGTALLKKNKIDGIPVRFIRSSKANSKYAPPVGFRYDGLYDVVDYKLEDKQKQRYCFTLVRQAGQGPIRGGNGPEARPTQQEVDRFKQDKRFRGFGSKD